ncbi:MAG: hypothetical protein ACKO9B_06085 [Planctomycetota bacterium]
MIRAVSVAPIALAVLSSLAAGSALRAADAPGHPAQPAPTPILFEGFGLEEFEGAESIVCALRHSDVRPTVPSRSLDLRVRGPTGVESIAAPVVAEIRSRVQGIDVAAGVQADRWMVAEGPNRVLGTVGIAASHERGRQSLELKTAVGQGDRAPRLTVEVGPRIERRLRRGVLLFLDGKAVAQSLREDQRSGGGLASPTFERMGLIGLTGRAGLQR